LNATGEYHVSPDGILTTYQPLDNDEGFKLTYTFDCLPELSLDTTWCVIPDFAETTALCTAALVTGTTYSITLPTVTKIYGISLGSSGRNATPMQTCYDLSPSDMYGYQCTLPKTLTDNLKSGDTIPSGYIQLFDSAARGGLGQVLSGGSWIYISPTQVQIVGLVLTAGSNRYRLVVPGHNVTEAVSKLIRAYNDHDHSGDWNDDDGHHGKRLSHIYLLNQVDEGGTAGIGSNEGFTESSIGPARNPHPQYLHRYGYRYSGIVGDGGSTTGNRHNALLGDLVISENTCDLDTTSASWKIYFGSTSGPSIHYKGDSSTPHEGILVSGKPLRVTEDFMWDSARDLWLQIHPADCATIDGVNWSYEAPGPGNRPYVQAIIAGQYADFSVTIPVGADISYVDLVLHETAGAIQWWLLAQPFDGTGLPGALDVLASGNTGGGGSGTEVQSALLGAPRESKPELERYFLRVLPAAAGDRFYGARVSYTTRTLTV
jgi:hypothetical protein